MTFVDFFAGIGGFRRGMELAGHKCLGFCEYDKFAVQSYRSIHKTEGEWYAKDIREVRANDIPRADIWCAGFPCQDVSIAGKCLGFKGKRSSLFFAITGLVRDLEEKDRPAYLFFENVKNLFSVNRGFDFARILIELDEVGYDAEWSLVNSSDVVPQNRERVFIVGRLRNGCGRKVFPVGESSKIHIGGQQIGKIHGDKVMTLTAKGQSNWTGTFIKQIYNIVEEKNYKNPRCGRVYDTSGIAPCLTCMEGGGLEPKVAIPCITPDRANKRQNGRRFKNNNDPMFTLTAQGRHGVVTGGICTDASPDSMRPPLKEKSRCLEANKADARVIIYDDKKYFIRKLTPLECWRLQGWDDESFFRAFFLDKNLAHKFNKAYQRHKHNPVRLMRWASARQKTSNSQLYKQAGNGVTVPVIQRIAEKFGLEE